MNNIYYLGFYDTVDNKDENRNIYLAATNKMSYIIKAIEKAGMAVTVISASQTLNSKKYNKKIVKLFDNSKLILFKTLPWGNKLHRAISIVSMKLNLISFILKNIGKNDTLMVYHSLYYARMVRILKKIKKFKLVLETEEIYSDVNKSRKDRKIEDAVFAVADSFIFSTELLNEKINKRNKPYITIYGTYDVEADRNCKFDDGKKHIVYAGTFDSRKGGALISVVSAEFLSSDYHMHIIGFGTESDTQKVKDTINEISLKTECVVTYDGLLSGEDYIRFLQSCDIGLSTQNPDSEYNDTSFPSKVLSYMANGMRVVSVKIPVLERSAIGDMLYYYEGNEPKKIAETVMSVDWNEQYESRKIIMELDKKFTKDIVKFLN